MCCPTLSWRGYPCSASQCLAVKNNLFCCAHLGGGKTFRKVSVRNLQEAGEGEYNISDTFRIVFRILFPRFSNHFSYRFHFWAGGGSFVLQTCRSNPFGAKFLLGKYEGSRLVWITLLDPLQAEEHHEPGPLPGLPPFEP